MSPRDPFGDGLAVDDVLLEDALAALRGDGAVPDALGVDEEPWAADANFKARGLGAHDRELQLGAAALEVIPHDLALLKRRAIGAEAEEEVALGAVNAGRGEAFVDGSVFGHAKKLTP